MKPTLAVIALGTALAASSAIAAETPKGEALHTGHCMACHAKINNGDANGLYTRPGRRVNTLEGLKKQVRFCESNLGLRWFDDEVAAVTDYLNTTFYKFKE